MRLRSLFYFCSLILIMSNSPENFAQSFSILGNGTGSNAANQFPAPFGNFNAGARHQFFVFASQLTAAGVPTGAQIQSIGFRVLNLNNCPELINFQIKVYTTTSNNPLVSGFHTGTPIAHSLPINHTPVVGWNQFQLFMPFVWNGTDNLVVETCFNNPVGLTNGNASTQWTTTLSSATFSRWYRDNSTTVCGSNTSNGFSNFIRPNIRIGWSNNIACSGSPAPGNTTANYTAACETHNIVLGLSNTPQGQGFTYQWQRSTDNGVTWTNFGSGGVTQAATLSPPVDTKFRCLVTCTNSGLTTASNPILITANTNDCQCLGYGFSLASSPTDGEIINVTIGSMTNSSTCSTQAPGYGSIAGMYSNYTSSVSGPSVYQGTALNFSISVGTCGANYAHGLKIFGDWNQDGDFSDSGEEVYVTPYSLAPPHTFTGFFFVPLSAVPGITRLRIVLAEIGNPYLIAPTGTYTRGETEDYCINVLLAPPCSGIPNPGNVTSSSTWACSGETLVLNISNPITNSGYAFNWEQSTDGGNTWTTFSTATPPFLYTFGSSTTKIRTTVTCTNSGLSTTSGVVTVEAGNNCQCAGYCVPELTAGNVGGNYVQNVSLNSGLLIANNSGQNSQTFTLYSGFNPSLFMGVTYSLAIQAGTAAQNDIRAWIDWNGNGIFENSESIGQTLNLPSGSTTTFNFTVPLSATPGSTRLRIRQVNTNATSVDPCATYSQGETEDYCVTLVLSQCTWTGNVPSGPVWGHWTNPGNWDCGFVPTSLTHVIIPNTPIQPAIVLADGNAFNLIIHDGARILINSNRRLFVGNDWIAGSGSGAQVTHSLGPVRMLASDGSAEMTGNTSFQNLEIAANAGSVTIQSGSVKVRNTLRLMSGTLNTNGYLTLEALNSPAHLAGIIDNFSPGFTGMLSGQVKAQRRLTRFGSVFLGSPINNGTISQMAAHIPGGLAHNGIGTDGSYLIADPSCTFPSPSSPWARIMQYNETAVTTCPLNGWQIRLSGTTQNGRGYMIHQPGSYNHPLYEFTGPANTGNINTPITRTASNISAEVGVNLLSNPYPSGIDLDAFYAHNSAQIGAMAYLYNGTTYVTVHMNDGAPSRIPSFQGFRVIKSNVGSGTVTFNQGMRVTGNILAFTDAMNVPYKLVVEITGNDPARRDETVVYFGENLSDTFDLGEDGIKFYSAEGYPTLYTLAPDMLWPMSVNGLNLHTSLKEVPIGLHPGAAGRFVFTLKGGDQMPEGLTCYLVDHKEQKEVKVGAETSYAFDINGTETRDRFVLRFMREHAATALAMAEPDMGRTKQTAVGTEADRAWAVGSRVYLSLGRDVPGRLMLSLVDMSGKVVWADAMHHIARGVYDLGELEVASGLYILTWSDSGESRSTLLALKP